MLPRPVRKHLAVALGVRFKLKASGDAVDGPHDPPQPQRQRGALGSSEAAPMRLFPRALSHGTIEDID